MLSSQYFNKGLKKNHIEKILTNYTIKYTTMRKEIENKINIMIKNFTEDISQFLNNMEEVAEHRKQIKSIENNQTELECLREQIKDNVHEQTQLKREIELLKLENSRLKTTYNSNLNTNTFNSPKKKIQYTPTSPSSPRESSYKNLNTASSLYNSTISSDLKRSKDINSLILKTEKKDKKEIKDSRIFKSPQVTQMKKGKKKISDFNLNENSITNNKNKNDIRKKEINKTHKNLLSFSTTEVNNESNKKNITFNSPRNITNKNKKNKIDFNKNKKNLKNSTIDKKIDTINKNKLLNKSVNINKNKDKNKDNTKTLVKSDSLVDNKIVESEDYSSEKENNTNNNENNESKSKTTSINYDEEEQTIIDEEINEMNYLEVEILSLMDQIKDFKQNNDSLT